MRSAIIVLCALPAIGAATVPFCCINSLRPLPYVKAWAAKYKDAGLVVIGVHTPEFSVEKERINVETAVRDLKVGYPVAIDSDDRIWRAFDNQYRVGI